MQLDLASLAKAYRSGQSVHDTVTHVLQQIDRSETNPIWISRVSDSALRARADELAAIDPALLPLYGVPFAIKDNIDLAGLPTTAACPAFAYVPRNSAAVVQKLLDAGAMAIGKTNMDQFATGLAGTRSPFGACRNSFDAAYISGGSSSGSAVAVALGQVSFALGTDTAGSGRVPAAFNNLVGYKPTLGHLSTRGMVPACRSLDAISVLSFTAGDAALIAQVAGGFDADDPWSRRPQLGKRGWSRQPTFRFGIPLPAQREFFGNSEYARLYDASIQHCLNIGGVPVETDIEPLLQTARLLYEGPWVAERYLAAQNLLETTPEALHPVTRQIIEAGRNPGALDTFRAQYRLRELAMATDHIWQSADVLLLPTAGTHYTIEEVDAAPLQLNSNLGRYTNFVNLLDLAAVAVPAGFTRRGLPFGVSLIAPAWQDNDLLNLAARIHPAATTTLGADATWPAVSVAQPPAPAMIDVAVCGAHMSGLPLNHQLTARAAWLVSATRTAPVYRFYALPGGPPARPGLVRVAQDGVAIEMEIWRMPEEYFGSFMGCIRSPLGIGIVQTASGQQLPGFLCEAVATQGALDISDLGGWRNYLAHLRPPGQ